MARWLQRFIGRGTRTGGGGGPALRLQVRCAACGEVIDVRVDTRHELRQDVDGGQDVRVLDKDLLGTRCFALLHVHAVLAPDLSVRAHEVSGGELISLSRAHD